MKGTRHNGRSGENGTYNPIHNDRRFNLENSEHIDAERTKLNLYWDFNEDAKETLQEKINRMLVTEASRMAVY